MILKEIPIDRIFPYKENVRKTFYVDDLVESIKSIGLLCPIAVREKDGHYEIIHGHRRFGAMKKLKFKEIPCIIHPEVKDETEVIIRQLVENVVRQNLDPIDEANKYYELWQYRNLSIREIAKRTGISKSVIHRRLSLLKLPPEVLSRLKSGELSQFGTEELASSKEIQKELIEKTLAENLTGKEIKFIRQMKEGKPDFLLKQFESFINNFLETYKKYCRELHPKLTFEQKRKWNKIYTKLKAIIFSYDGWDEISN